MLHVIAQASSGVAGQIDTIVSTLQPAILAWGAGAIGLALVAAGVAWIRQLMA